MVLEYFAYAAVGKLLIWTVQTSGPFRPIWSFLEARWPKIEEMHECGWCVGCWVYTALAYLLQVSMLGDLTYSLIGCIITGIVTSFLMQALSFGLQNWFGWYNYSE